MSVALTPWHNNEGFGGRMGVALTPWWIGAQQCAVLANVNRGRGSRSYDVDDFMPRPRKQQTSADMKAQLMAMAVINKDVRK